MQCAMNYAMNYVKNYAINYAINYYKDFVLPNKKYLNIDDNNKVIFEEIHDVLKLKVNESSSAEEIQTLIYEVGKQVIRVL